MLRTQTLRIQMLRIQMRRTQALRTTALLCAALTLTATVAPSASAQSPHPLEFEVATIKPVDPHATNNSMGTDVDPGGTVRLNSFPLKTMIEVAFNVSYWQIQGGEPWMANTLYNLVGQPPDSVRQSLPDTRHSLFSIQDPQLREMLQTLLIQRFQLKVHLSTQTGKVYLLERTSQPLALHPNKTAPTDASAPQSRFSSIGWAGRWGIYDSTMPDLASFASSFILHRPVLDRTSLTGAFDYQADPDDPNAPVSDHDSSFMRILNDAGLKLTPSTGPAEILTIDHAEPPSPN